jgi:hypothetical protein
MKKVLLIFCLSIASTTVFGQTMLDYKVKNTSNVKDRTMMLDILRANLYQDYKQEFIFVVDVFNVTSNFAWFKGSVQRKDGRKVALDGDGYDCCHVEALFKKSADKWYIVESAAFSTDVWYDGIWNRVKAPKIIFGDDYHN